MKLPHGRPGQGGAPFRGSIVALPTPFVNGAVDLRGIERLVDFQCVARTRSIAVGGTTGEGWALNVDETVQLAARAVSAASRRSDATMRVFGQIAETDSRRAAQLAEQMVHAGVDGLFVGAPSHVQPGPNGLLRHFEEVVERLPWGVPIALHNEPGRTGFDVSVDLGETAAREFPMIVARCEGVGVPGRARHLARETSLDVVCGDDRMLGPYLRSGAVGGLNAVGNLVPAEVALFIESVEQDLADADGRERALSSLIDALRAGAHPVPLKESLALLGAITSEVRPPLVSMGTTQQGDLRNVLELARMLVPA